MKIERVIMKKTDLYDSDSGETLFAYKTVPIPNTDGEIWYIDARRGRIAQIITGGGITHFFINENTVLAKDEIFASRAKILGITPEELSDFIYKNQ